MKKLTFFNVNFQNSRCNILQNTSMSNFVILKRRPFEYKVKFEEKKSVFYLGPK